MRVIVTSFRDAVNWPSTHRYSIARWQPAGEHYPEIKELAARDIRGKPLTDLEPDEFRVLYEERLAGIGGWTLRQLLDRHLTTPPDSDIVLLCWCNHGRQKGYTKLYCHRILVGFWIEKHYSDIEVIYADGADKPVWDRNK